MFKSPSQLPEEARSKMAVTLNEPRNLAAKCGDEDSSGLFTDVITQFEKHAWFLRASLDT
jgi:DNA-binding ferritin-like protein